MTSLTSPAATIPPITVEQLRESLRKGPVRFAFKKTDGSLRIAYGTLDLSKIPGSQHPHNAPSSNKMLPFYDLEKFVWRSVSIGQLIFG